MKENREYILVRPFLKWVGGKGRVIAQLQQYFPNEFKRYFEPFVGGGAVFFHLNACSATINDINETLIDTYVNIRDHASELIDDLHSLEKQYHNLDLEAQKDMFYRMRDEYNSIKNTKTIRRSVLLIYLNKTCFNGMYRENRKGEYNVPFGKYHNPKICDESNLLEISKCLQNTAILHNSYKDAVRDAKEGDFVYLDPPYYPLNPTSSFTSYSEADFTEKDQVELKELFDDLNARGCKVMLSNSNTQFIINLYKDYKQYKVYVGRSINSNGLKRGKIAEIVVTNY